jgi:hypothetical protein
MGVPIAIGIGVKNKKMAFETFSTINIITKPLNYET